MGRYVISMFLAIGIYAMIGFVFSFQYRNVSDSDNETAVVNSARNGMTEAVNLGGQRVNEKVTINEAVAVEATLRMYAAASDFDDGARYLNVYDVKSDPAYIAVESYLEINTPFRNMINQFRKEKLESQPEIARSREIVIYEAKEVQRPSRN